MRIFFLLIFFTQLCVYSQNPTIESFTKGFQKKNGFIDYYWDDDKGRLYIEVKELDKEFLYVNYLSAGVGSNDIGLDRGQIGGTRIIKFVKKGPKVLMVQPNYKYRAVSYNNNFKYFQFVCNKITFLLGSNCTIIFVFFHFYSITSWCVRRNL